jgi:hypothetical protein
MIGALTVAKFAATTITSIGVGKILKGVIQNNVDVSTPLAKVTVSAAGIVVGGVIRNRAAAWIDEQVDEAVTSWKKMRNYDKEEKPSEEVE